MVDSCRQLTISQSNGDEDTAGMVTILTGHQVEELCTRSAAMKVSSRHLFICFIFSNLHFLGGVSFGCLSCACFETKKM